MTIRIKNPFERLDDYELRYYLIHLAGAGRDTDVHQVLSRQSTRTEEVVQRRGGLRGWLGRLSKRQEIRIDKSYKNAWYIAHENIGETGSFLNDVALAWRLAEQRSVEAISNNRLAATVALEVRYALISSCVNNLASNIPPPLLAQFIEHDLLSPSQGVTYARQVPNLSQRALSLAAVAPHLHEPARREVLEQALATTQIIRDETARAETLVKLAAKVGQPLLTQIVSVAQGITYDASRIKALIGIAPHLNEPAKSEVVRQAFDTAQDISREQDRTLKLIELAPLLPEPLKAETFRRTLSTIEASSGEYWQAEAVELFIRHAPTSLISHAQTITQNIQDEHQRTMTQASFASRFAAEGDAPVAIKLIQSFKKIEHNQQRAKALVGAAPYFPKSQMRKALDLIFKISTEQYRADALIAFTPYLPESLLLRVVKAARAMRDKEQQGRVLAALVGRLPDTVRQETLTAVLRVLLENPSSVQAEAEPLNLIIPYLSTTQLREVLATAQKISDRKEQIITAAVLAAGLPPDIKRIAVQQTIKVAREIKDESERSESFVPLTGRLTELGESDSALAVAWGLRPVKYCAQALSEITPLLPAESRRKVMEKALAQWGRLSDESLVPDLLSVITSHLDKDLIPQAVAIARGLKGEFYKITALIGLTPYVSLSVLRESVIQEEWAIKGSFSTFGKGKLRIAIAKRLAQLGRPEDAFTLAQSLEQDQSRVDAFENIIPYLPEDSLGQVLKATQMIGYEGARHAVLGALAPRFAELGHEEIARSLIAEIKSGLQRAMAAARTVPFATEPLRSDAMKHALIIITNMQEALGEHEHWWQSQALSVLAPHLPQELLEEAWPLALNIETEGERRRALAALAIELANLHPAVLYPLWAKGTRRLAVRSRRNFLNDLQALAPIILGLGGADATAEIIKTIHDIGRWW